MDSDIVWLLDVTIEQNHATLRIKTIDGAILRLTDTYRPHFYVLPKNEQSGAEPFHSLSQQPKIKKVEWENRHTDLFDHDRHGMKRLICVYPESINHHKIFSKKLQNDTRVAQLFNIDLSHVQQYLFTKLKVEPTNKVQVQYDKDDLALINLTKMDELSVQPPPFSTLYFEVKTSSSYYILGSYDVNDPITRINARYQEQEIVFQGREETILKDFCKYILTTDPDILVATKQHYRNTSILNCLFARMSELVIDIELGRDNQTNKRANIE
ncbi:MAG: hypothetical protein WCC17_19045 [Candidatus Nitrosopolaris sp.]